MLDLLRTKPGSEALIAVEGDFVDTTVDERFAVVLLAFNTLFGLPSQERQVTCFANAARHRRPGGAFVIECVVPGLSRFRDGQATRTVDSGTHEVHLGCSRHDPTRQRVDSAMMRLGPAGNPTCPVSGRHAWPAELDLMAQLAGLELESRWAGWRRGPFDRRSTTHVSVYRVGG